MKSIKYTAEKYQTRVSSFAIANQIVNELLNTLANKWTLDKIQKLITPQTTEDLISYSLKTVEYKNLMYDQNHFAIL